MADVPALMKRCQIGVPRGPNAYDDLHSILAECYGTLGSLGAENARLRGRAKYLRDVGEHKSSQLLDEAAQRISPAWFCPRCKVDRFKEDCPNRIGCPMVGIAASPEVPNA